MKLWLKLNFHTTKYMKILPLHYSLTIRCFFIVGFQSVVMQVCKIIINYNQLKQPFQFRCCMYNFHITFQRRTCLLIIWLVLFNVSWTNIKNQYKKTWIFDRSFLLRDIVAPWYIPQLKIKKLKQDTNYMNYSYC